MITGYLVGDKEVIAKFNRMPQRVHDQLVQVITRLGIRLDQRVKQKLSGEVLNVRTGVLRASVHNRITQTPTSVISTEGTNVKYARFHEFGVPHSWVIEARNAEALHFQINGQDVFRRRVVHPPLPERSFLRSALREMTPEIKTDIVGAVGKAVHE
jgi:hypothetical protein